MGMKDDYQQKLEAKLEEWNAELDKLRAKAKGAEADAEREINKEVAQLEERRERARARLEELRAASDDAWHDFKAGAERAFDEMSEAVRQAVARFR